MQKSIFSNINFLPIIFSIIFCVSILNISSAQDNLNNNNSQSKYSQVRIFIASQQDIQRLANSGLFLDHGIRKDNFFETWLSEVEIKMLQLSGVSYDVTIPDWDYYYNSLPKMTPTEIQDAIQESIDDYNVSHSIYGTMGGHLKWEEAIAKLDSMKSEYPGLISTKFSIGNSYENKPLWTVRVSNNPEVVSGKPQIWLNGMTHAREPLGMSNILYYMYWLFENYNIDPIATYILNNREIYVTPFINPDGYYYNQTTNPNGGGMWRKNRTPQGSYTGVDLNRNYGIYQFWNSSNGGSSTNPSSDTYRGTAPFSEPETQVVRDFVNSKSFKSIFNYHTYGNYLIRPWAWCDPIAPPDSMTYHEWAADMTQFNSYLYGVASTTVGYKVRGDACDWMHHDSGHAKTFPFTPEVGTAGFWPSQSLILPQAQSCVWMNIYHCMIAGAFIYPNLTQFNQQYYNPGNSGNLRVLFKNKGQASAQNVKIQWTSPSSYITIPTSVYSYPNINSLVKDSSIFNFSLSGSVPNNSAIPTVLKFKQEDTNIVHTEALYVLIGTGLTTFADSAENGFSNWTTNQGWAVTTSQYHTPTHSFTDSPFGSYQNNANNSMTLSAPINISSYPVVFLSFWHRYNTEAGYDYCNVEVSSNNGITWQKISSYNGVHTSWTQEVFDITSYANGTSQLKIRFTLTSDVYITADGWYVDDIKLTNYTNVVTNINPNITTLKYSLLQNYPNPFNPNTTIKFEIPRAEFTQLVIYDALGREVAKLVSKELTAGSYEVEWNAENYGSGIYFYQLKAGSFIETKKMMLLK